MADTHDTRDEQVEAAVRYRAAARWLEHAADGRWPARDAVENALRLISQAEAG